MEIGGHLPTSRRKELAVAVVQASPAYPNTQESLRVALAFIEKAAAAGAKLICLGETFLPGYPAWLDYCEGAALWNHPPVKEVFAELRANSIVVPGPETGTLSEVAAKLEVGIVIGIHERIEDGPGHGSLYNSLLFFREDGSLVNQHRKLIPTYSERMIWANGDAAGLRCAKIQDLNVGGLICWEHWMPLARQHMHNHAGQVHIAAWPTVHEMHQVASRHYAFEGRCFVLAAGQIMRASALPVDLCSASVSSPDHLVERGGSAIIARMGGIWQVLFLKTKRY
jgi:predicted amidohydrolase